MKWQIREREGNEKNLFPLFGNGNQRLSFPGMDGNRNSRSPLISIISILLHPAFVPARQYCIFELCLCHIKILCMNTSDLDAYPYISYLQQLRSQRQISKPSRALRDIILSYSHYFAQDMYNINCTLYVLTCVDILLSNT